MACLEKQPDVRLMFCLSSWAGRNVQLSMDGFDYRVTFKE